MDPTRTVFYFLLYSGIFPFLSTIKHTNGQDDFESQDTAIYQNKTETGCNLYYKLMTGKAASLLQTKFKDISFEELGMTALNEILNSLHRSSRTITDDDYILTISERLSVKINAAIQILLEMKRNILNDSNVQSFTYPCPLNSFRKSHNLENIEINSEKVTLNIPKNNFKSYIKNTAKKYNLKVETQYFMATSDGGTDEMCGVVTARGTSRRLFHKVLQSLPKSVLILVDNGYLVTKEELHSAVSVAKELINALQSEDTVALSLLGTSPQFVQLHTNCDEELVSSGLATDSTRELFYKQLNSAEVVPKLSNITAGFSLAVELLKSLDNAKNSIIVYLGKKSSLILEWKLVASLLSEVKTTSAADTVFSGCNVEINHEKNELPELPGEEKTDFNHINMMLGGLLIDFNASMTAGQVASLLLLKLPVNADSEEVGAEPPIWEPKQKHLPSPFLLPLYVPVHPLGLLVVELYLSDVAEDIIYFNSFSTNHRAFIIDFNGNVIVHSAYPRPELIVTKPTIIDISNLEIGENFELVKFNLLHNSSGKVTNDSISYTWKWIKNLYIVCVVSESVNGTSPIRNIRLSSGIARELQHHRMDLLPPPNTPLCRHFLMVSTIHKGTLYLSPSSFQSPFTYMFDLNNGKDVSFTLIRSYMAYLIDPTRLLSNPGLKPDVKNDVGILNRMLSYFKAQHIRGAYNKYIVRRYAASEHGVLVLFPGTILESDFEPNRKPWFLRALRNPGKVILTPPYLDIGGAGYIVTISQAPALVTQKSKPAVVLSVDMTMRYLYKMLLDALPMCTEVNMRCFLMDDRGYLLSHPGLVDPSNSGPVEQTHITHEESLIANDMLNHREFVQKKLCKNFADSTLQRFYQFNTSLDKILTNFVNGEHCARYHIAAIPGTNAFVGMVNSTCSLGAFCPCSVVDRLCLNCNRMEQNECECPCECQLLAEDSCSAVPVVAPLCEFESERTHRNNYYTQRYNLAPHLDSCFDFQCESYNTRASCLGVLGCEWCELDRDAESLLSCPFCTAQPTCFGGVLGAPTPYEVGSFGQVTQDDLSPAYSAVGPIVGCFVALCLILALAVYCYKQNLTSADSVEPFPPAPESWPRTGMQMNHLNSEDDIHDERSGHQDKLLLANEPVAPISPYRILTGYRRPNTAGESDHGYSTMTPHDDSEHQAFALVEPFLPQETADGGSSPAVSTPRSSATELPMTVLPCGKNNIIAPVTVHRHMEAT